MNESFGFCFSIERLGTAKGATDPVEEHFKNRPVNEVLVRELTQNSLDACLDKKKPVRIEIEKKVIDVAEIPDLQNLRHHLRASIAAVGKSNKLSRRLANADAALRNEKIKVVRIGDFNTHGLKGDEDADDLDTSLFALTRGSGISVKQVGDGGSFGVGARTASLASEIRTVFWMTKSTDHETPVLAGRSILCSHKTEESKKGFHSADGYFRRITDEKFEYLRTNKPFLGFAPRSEYGTDTFILGYRGVDEDDRLIEIMRSFARNFMVPIQEEELEVELKGTNGWVLNKESLAEFLKSDKAPESERYLAYFRAIQESPIFLNTKDLGEIELYLLIDPNLDSWYPTMMMRRPRMLTHFDVRMRPPRINLAAVVICRGDKANQFLQTLEPTTHDIWSPENAEDPNEANRILTRMLIRVRQAITSELREEFSNEAPRIRGVEEYFPGLVDESFASNQKSRAVNEPDLNELDRVEEQVESENLKGRDFREVLTPRVSVPEGTYVSHPAVAGDGLDDIRSGIRRGGRKRRDKKGGDLEGHGSGGSGSSRISGDALRVRPISDKKTGNTILRLFPKEQKLIHGDIRLIPISEGVTLESDYQIGIESVQAFDGNSYSKVLFSGNLIKNISVPATGLELNIKLRQNRRFSLVVE